MFNYITDPTGASKYTATITIADGTVPSSVQVKYFLSDSVATKNNITWAGQVRLSLRLCLLIEADRSLALKTLGQIRQVDGRFKGDLNVVTIVCDTAANTCLIPVPAPAFALVYLTPEEDIATVTFATSTYTNAANTATIAASVLATSNGMSGKDWEQLGSTSKGSISGAVGGYVRANFAGGLVGAVVAALVLL